MDGKWGNPGPPLTILAIIIRPATLNNPALIASTLCMGSMNEERPSKSRHGDDGETMQCSRRLKYSLLGPPPSTAGSPLNTTLTGLRMSKSRFFFFEKRYTIIKKVVSLLTVSHCGDFSLLGTIERSRSFMLLVPVVSTFFNIIILNEKKSPSLMHSLDPK